MQRQAFDATDRWALTVPEALQLEIQTRALGRTRRIERNRLADGPDLEETLADDDIGALRARPN